MSESTPSNPKGAPPSGPPLRHSARCGIAPFIVMDVMRAANAKMAEGADVIHMEVGQPSAGAPAPVIAAAHRALDAKPLGYTEALGLPELRARISRHYHDTYDADIPACRVVVTTGSSAGFLLSFLAAFDVGASVATSSPGYPCYRNILQTLGVRTRTIQMCPQDRYAPTPGDLERLHGEKPLDGFLLASPANPTGVMVEEERLSALAKTCRRLGLWMISDEIYHGLTYAFPARTALAYNDDAIVINSFSKYYAMTGWRIGWMVVPEFLVRPIERLAQNLFIAPPAISQYAALAAFESRDELEALRHGYAVNRDLLISGLQEAGLDRITPPDGAFYIYADVSQFCDDSADFAARLLDQTGIAATPGSDFDPDGGARYLRFSYAGARGDMEAAGVRLRDWLAKEGRR